MAERVLVCMSGGVDSTVAALLLLEAGHDVAGVTFWFWSFPGAPDYAGKTKCCSLTSASLAAQELGIPHRTIDASEDFYNLVLKDFTARYRRGETPSPCGRCNRLLRFGLALRLAAEEGFDRVATGHHARIVVGDSGRRELHRAKDAAKDQSYFLYGLREDDLERLAFPVGTLAKEEVFAVARRRGLHAATLPESQDLCFALEGKVDFLFRAEDFAPGPILDREGRVLGEHEGLPRYTIGQRRGIGISSPHPLYVVALDRATNALVVGEERDLYSCGLEAVEASFLSGEPPGEGTRVEAKVRYRSPPVPARFHAAPGAGFLLEFDSPERAVTPGQVVALYDGDRLLGGGTIARALRPNEGPPWPESRAGPIMGCESAPRRGG